MGRRTASAARPTLHPFTSSAAEAFASTRTVREPFTPPFARALSASGALMPTQVADIIFSLFSLWCVCVCVCGPDDACLTTRAVRVCIPWRATVYERCRLRCSCVCTRLWSAGCEKALRLLMMTSLVGGEVSFSRLSIEELGDLAAYPLLGLAGVMSAPRVRRSERLMSQTLVNRDWSP
jgi:hypothetical protein